MPSLPTLDSLIARLQLPQSEPALRRPITPLSTSGLGSLLEPYQAAVSGAPTELSGPDPTRWLDLLAQTGPGTTQDTSTTTSTPTTGDLASRRGVTLQTDALNALVQALRQYDLKPGARELGMFGPQATYRTQAEQAALYAAKPGVAAPPGHSYHQQGLAIDLPSALQTQAFFDLLSQLGWNQFSPSGEPWHWSYGVTG